ncbi:MAG: tetratricopeptide repeat protein, partial [Promethearchaeota archaeon]
MELNNLPDSVPEELVYADQLIYQCKFKDALDIIINFEKRDSISYREQLMGLIIKGKLFGYKEQYKKAAEIGEVAYRLSQKIGDDSKTIDALILKAHIGYLRDVEIALGFITKAEEIFNSISHQSSTAFSRQKADLLRIKSKLLHFKGAERKSLDLALQWLKIQERFNKKLEISQIYCQIGELYLYKNEPDLALDYFLRSLKIQKDLNNRIGIARSLSLVGLSYYVKGNFDQALICCKKSLMISEIGNLTKIETLHSIGAIYKEKGELDRTIRHYNRAVRIAEKEDYIDGVIINLMGLGASYRMKKELDRALIYLERSWTISKNVKSTYGIRSSLFYLILVNLDKKSIKKAKFYLEELNQYTDLIENTAFNQAFTLAKALVLKNSGRIRNRTEAELLLKQITLNEVVIPTLHLIALVNLCDLFLEELYITDNIDVLNELNPLINNILKIAEKQNSYLWLAETRLLQAKLALIQMDIDKAMQFLTQAQRIAELHGLNLLASKISSEYDS